MFWHLLTMKNVKNKIPNVLSFKSFTIDLMIYTVTIHVVYLKPAVINNSVHTEAEVWTTFKLIIQVQIYSGTLVFTLLTPACVVKSCVIIIVTFQNTVALIISQSSRYLLWTFSMHSICRLEEILRLCILQSCFFFNFTPFCMIWHSFILRHNVECQMLIVELHATTESWVFYWVSESFLYFSIFKQVICMILQYIYTKTSIV